MTGIHLPDSRAVDASAHLRVDSSRLTSSHTTSHRPSFVLQHIHVAPLLGGHHLRLEALVWAQDRDASLTLLPSALLQLMEGEACAQGASRQGCLGILM